MTKQIECKRCKRSMEDGSWTGLCWSCLDDYQKTACRQAERIADDPAHPAWDTVAAGVAADIEGGVA